MQPAVPEVDDTLQRAALGDTAARAALVRTYGPLVWSICRRMGREPEDAYQEIWEKVLKAVGRFDPSRPESLKSWIATIAHRHMVDRHRRRKTRGVVVELREIPAVDPRIDERLARRQQVSRLEAALARLPEGQRRVVVMHHLHGESLEAIAQVETVAVGTVKSRLHRGRARLAALLGEAG